MIGQFDDYITIGVLHLSRLSVDGDGFLFVNACCFWPECVHLAVIIEFDGTIYDPNTASIAVHVTSMTRISNNEAMSIAMNYAGSRATIDDNIVIAPTVTIIVRAVLFAGVGIRDDPAPIGSDQYCFAIGSTNDLPGSV